MGLCVKNRSQLMRPGHEEPVRRILAISYETLGGTLADRPRQLRDEMMSGVNQHANMRLIHRRYLLLVP